MTLSLWYALLGGALFVAGTFAIIVQAHLARRLIAMNVMGTGVFLIYVAVAARSGLPDPVPHAMVLTGLVVSVSATALGLNLTLRLKRNTGQATLPEDGA